METLTSCLCVASKKDEFTRIVNYTFSQMQASIFQLSLRAVGFQAKFAFVYFEGFCKLAIFAHLFAEAKSDLPQLLSYSPSEGEKNLLLINISPLKRTSLFIRVAHFYFVERTRRVCLVVSRMYLLHLHFFFHSQFCFVLSHTFLYYYLKSFVYLIPGTENSFFISLGKAATNKSSLVSLKSKILPRIT